MVFCTSPIGLHRSDSITISESGEGAKAIGRLARSAGASSIACAIFSSTLRRPRWGARAAVQRVNEGGGARAPFENEQRRGVGEHTSAAGRLPYCARLDVGELRLGHLGLSDAGLEPPDHVRNGFAFGAGGESQRHAV